MAVPSDALRTLLWPASSFVWSPWPSGSLCLQIPLIPYNLNKLTLCHNFCDYNCHQGVLWACPPWLGLLLLLQEIIEKKQSHLYFHIWNLSYLKTFLWKLSYMNFLILKISYLKTVLHENFPIWKLSYLKTFLFWKLSHMKTRIFWKMLTMLSTYVLTSISLIL